MTDAPETPTESPPESEGTEPEATDETINADPAQLLAENRKKNREAAGLRKQLKEAQTAIETLTAAAQTDQEKRDAELMLKAREDERAVWLPKVRNLTLQSVLQDKVVDAELAARLLPDDVDFEDTSAIDKAVEQLLADHPVLAPNGKSNGSSFPQGPRGSVPDKAKTPNDFLMDVLGVGKH